jgi:hypothetical protein
MYETINSRIKKIREHFCNDSNKVFAYQVGEKPNTVNNWIREGYSVNRGVASKLTEKFPVDLNWLLTGEGEMLRPLTINQQKSHIEGCNGGIGQVAGGHVEIHHDEGKDKFIEKQEEQVSKSYLILCEELKQFHHELERKDEYLKSIVAKSFHRNEQNLERIDQSIRIINENTSQMSEIIKIIALQNEKIQDRADKLMEILNRKL